MITYLVIQAVITVLIIILGWIDLRRDVVNGQKFCIRTFLGFFIISFIPLLNIIIAYSFILEELSMMNIEDKINTKITNYIKSRGENV